MQIDLALARLAQTTAAFVELSRQNEELTNLVRAIRNEAERIASSLTAPHSPSIDAHLNDLSMMVDDAVSVLRNENGDHIELRQVARSLGNVRELDSVAGLRAAASRWSEDAAELDQLIEHAGELSAAVADGYSELLEETRDVGLKLYEFLNPTGHGGYRLPPF